MVRRQKWMSNMEHVLSFALAVALAVPAAAAAQTAPAAPPADVIGTWNASFNTQQGVILATMTLRRAGEKITGTIGSPNGEGPLEAEVKGKTLWVWFNYDVNGNQIPIEMTGTVEGDAASGTMTAAGDPAGDWTARRSKDTTDAKNPAAPAGSVTPDLSGTWTASLQLDAITATPSFTLKQNGSQLSGEYVSQQYGKFPLTGTATGTTVTFTVSMNVEGNQVDAVYSGVLQADGSLKGTVDIGGGAMAGSFSATRKQ